MTSTFPIDNVLQTLRPFVDNLHTPVVELVHAQTKDPFKILLATILSSRTKDDVTAKAAKKLFTKVDTPKDLVKLSLVQLEKLIYPVGFYKTKAKHLNALPKVLENEFKGILPTTLEELMKLPGVGRKTANLVVAVAFKKPAICVDTHVHRITNRWGYVRTKTPYETEMRLRKKLPKTYWLSINWMLVSFGQAHCTPLRPKCSSCPIKQYCKRVGVKNSL
ncbi:MAG: endonuclease III domain-containing protein [Candidatus Nanoarchaeia archaeon]